MGDETLMILYRAIAEDLGGEFGVSLLVGGSWLSGVAISGRAWWSQMAETIRQTPRGGGLEEAFETLGRMIYPSVTEVEAGAADPVDENRPLTYIHLRDARLFTGADMIVPVVTSIRLTDTSWGPSARTPASSC